LSGVQRELAASDPRPLLGLNPVDLACRKKGLRLTHQRRAIAGVLSKARDHPDIQQLHRRVATIDPSVSIATVYRTMKLFEEHRFVWSHTFRGERARYEWAADSPHDHIIDAASGKITNFRSEDVQRILAEIALNLGYRMVSYRLELYALPIELRASQAENAFGLRQLEVSPRKNKSQE
jgi:Fur family ferric uptake transcriptional regulator